MLLFNFLSFFSFFLWQNAVEALNIKESFLPHRTTNYAASQQVYPLSQARSQGVEDGEEEEEEDEEEDEDDTTNKKVPGQ